MRAAEQEAVAIWTREHGPPLPGMVLLEECRAPGDVGRADVLGAAAVAGAAPPPAAVAGVGGPMVAAGGALCGGGGFGGGLGVPAAAAALLPLAPAVALPVVAAHGVPGYLVAKAEHGYRFGDPIAVPAGTAIAADGKCIVDLGGGRFVFAVYVRAEDLGAFLDGAVVDEARLLPIRRSPAGERTRSWTSIADDSRLEEFRDWPIVGPRSVAWCLSFLKQEGRNIEPLHERVRQLAKADYSSWGVIEHKEISGYLQHLCGYDQLDPAILACAESMFRRLQTIEFSYLEKIRNRV